MCIGCGQAQDKQKTTQNPPPPIVTPQVQQAQSEAVQQSAEDVKKSEPASSAKLQIDEFTASPGSKIDIPVMLLNSSMEIDAFGFAIHYNKDILDYVSLEKGELTKDFLYVDGKKRVDGQAGIGGFHPYGRVPMGSSGSIVILTFQVKESANPGDVSEIRPSNLVDDIQGAQLQNGKLTIVAKE